MERKRSRFGDADAEPQTVASAAPSTAAAAAATGAGERVLGIKKKIYPPIVQYPQADFAGLVKRERSRIQGAHKGNGAPPTTNVALQPNPTR